MTQNHTKRPPIRQFGFVKFSFFLSLGLILFSWVFVIKVDGADLFALFSEKNLHSAIGFLKNMFGVGVENPAFTDAESWQNALYLTFKTLEMSIMAIGFAAIGMLFTVVPAARNAADGSLTLSRNWYGRLVFLIVRGIYVFTRAIPELIWAMMIIFIFQPGILPGAIALALHNFGILGKLCAEVIEDLDTRPIRGLASSGASKAQMLIYGVIPTVLPRFITYILYRWEVIIRTTIVVGFVGAGGLGRQFKLSMSFFHYTEITLFLICYIGLVVVADLVSAGLRKGAE
ncbi:MAG TPA: ABC transporter permease subunit [Bacillales bacterium]